MHQLARLARCGHKVVPAPRDMQLGVHAQNAPGDGVAVMMVVKEPAVKAGLLDGSLYCFKVHTGHDTRAGRKVTFSGVGSTLYGHFQGFKTQETCASTYTSIWQSRVQGGWRVCGEEQAKRHLRWGTGRFDKLAFT